MFSHHTQDETLGSSLWSAEVWVPCPFFPALFTPCRSFLPTVSTHTALLYFFVRSLAEMFFLQKLPGLSLCVAEDSAQISRPERDPPWAQQPKVASSTPHASVATLSPLFTPRKAWEYWRRGKLSQDRKGTEKGTWGQAWPVPQSSSGAWSSPLGFPGSSAGKESACNAGNLCSVPGWRRCPEGGPGNPLQYSYLENPMDRGAWKAT